VTAGASVRDICHGPGSIGRLALVAVRPTPILSGAYSARSQGQKMVRRREKETAQPASGRLAQFRVAVAAPTQLEQAALQALLATFPGIVVVAIDAVPPPHVLFWAAAAVTSSPPAHGEQTAVLALVTDLPAPTGVDLAGMFARDEKPEALGAAIRQVARGQEYLSPSLALALLQRQHGLPETPATARLEELTEREREIDSCCSEKGLATRQSPPASTSACVLLRATSPIPTPSLAYERARKPLSSPRGCSDSCDTGVWGPVR
jgi:hypothetical protein